MQSRQSGSVLQRVLVALGAAGWVACAEESEPPPNAATLLSAAEECRFGYHLCDTTDAACQQRLAEIAACLWAGPGTAPLMPEVSTLTPDQVDDRLRELSGDPDTAGAEAENAALAAFDDVLTWIGLIDAGMLGEEASLERTSSALLAFYEFDTKTIKVVDRQEADLRVTNGTLLHEFIHALQDADFDLGQLRNEAPPSTDALIALQSLYEGEAQFLQGVFELPLYGLPTTPANVESALQFVRNSQDSAVFMNGNLLPSSLQAFPYTYGALWIYDTWLLGGSPRVHEHYAAPPETLLDIVRAAWRAPRDPVELTAYPAPNVFPASAAPDAEQTPLGADRLGPWPVYLLAYPALSPVAAQDLALAWRGDQLDVFELDSGDSAGRWRFAFESEAAAQDFADVMGGAANVTLRVDGSNVVLVIAQVTPIPEWLFGPLAN